MHRFTFASAAAAACSSIAIFLLQSSPLAHSVADITGAMLVSFMFLLMVTKQELEERNDLLSHRSPRMKFPTASAALAWGKDLPLGQRILLACVPTALTLIVAWPHVLVWSDSAHQLLRHFQFGLFFTCLWKFAFGAFVWWALSILVIGCIYYRKLSVPLMPVMLGPLFALAGWCNPAIAVIVTGFLVGLFCTTTETWWNPTLYQKAPGN